ncbi:uridine diphosphate glucose pyrophosphatase NUDT22 isoform X2 [Clupea harengus]|uniref:Uridine diphosphate glucose pyrophosphatase NUDT22 isoform X2 n=1 Tax=Clupea harengus TaxID=7950 RepID=A0A6P8GVI8_CLUHA|nr:uridine diphosphate glucose pyrophosphatase NUDT22 isoform X2 [Clupea harengus]
MDPDVSVLLHCAPWRGLRERQIQVELSSRFNRHILADAEKHIDSLWEERTKREPWLFNGAKFRLHSAKWTRPPSPTATPYNARGAQDEDKVPLETSRQQRCCSDGEGCDHTQKHTHCGGQPAVPAPETCSGDRPVVKSHSLKDTGHQRVNKPVQLSLQLGLTCYKDYLGTNWSKRVGELQKRGGVELGDPQALLAQPLGVGAVMTTADGQVVLLRRSQKVAEAAGLLDIPGGHPEPKAVCKAISEESITVELLQGREEAVLMEIFSSVLAEIRDEVNLPLSSLSEPILLGIALNHTSAGRPSAEFYVRIGAH